MQVEPTAAEFVPSTSPLLVVLALAVLAACAALLVVLVLRLRRRDGLPRAQRPTGDGPSEVPASDNPYASPRAATPPPLPPDVDQLNALRSIRAAVMLLTPAAALNLAASVASGAGTNPSSPAFLFYVGNTILGTLALLIVPAVFWMWGLQIVHLVAGLVHRLLGGRVPRDEWLRATRAALWPLPYAAALGALVWLAFTAASAVGLRYMYGWYVVCGTLGHLLGAWCYLTVFWHWYRVRRKFARA